VLRGEAVVGPIKYQEAIQRRITQQKQATSPVVNVVKSNDTCTESGESPSGVDDSSRERGKHASDLLLNGLNTYGAYVERHTATRKALIS